MDLSEIPAGAFTRHPWEVARARFFGTQLERLVVNNRPLAVLDVGAGDGYLAEQVAGRLPTGSQIVCFDPLYTDDFMQDARALRGARCSFTRERPSSRFDVLMLLDVLEHVEHDLEMLTELVTHALVPGGHALLSVPAHAALFSRHDVSLGHYRRYSAEQLRRLATGAGLQILRGNGLFHSMLPRRTLTKAAELATGQQSIPSVNGPATGDTALAKWRGNAMWTALVTGVLYGDTALSAGAALVGVPLPGLSTWVLARKP